MRVSVVTHPHGGHVLGVFADADDMNEWINHSEWDQNDVATHHAHVRGIDTGRGDQA